MHSGGETLPWFWRKALPSLWVFLKTYFVKKDRLTLSPYQTCKKSRSPPHTSGYQLSSKEGKTWLFAPGKASLRFPRRKPPPTPLAQGHRAGAPAAARSGRSVGRRAPLPGCEGPSTRRRPGSRRRLPAGGGGAFSLPPVRERRRPPHPPCQRPLTGRWGRERGAPAPRPGRSGEQRPRSRGPPRNVLPPPPGQDGRRPRREGPRRAP